jgi:hypothetical protein
LFINNSTITTTTKREIAIIERNTRKGAKK